MLTTTFRHGTVIFKSGGSHYYRVTTSNGTFLGPLFHRGKSTTTTTVVVRAWVSNSDENQRAARSNAGERIYLLRSMFFLGYCPLFRRGKRITTVVVGVARAWVSSPDENQQAAGLNAHSIYLLCTPEYFLAKLFFRRISNPLALCAACGFKGSSRRSPAHASCFVRAVTCISGIPAGHRFRRSLPFGKLVNDGTTRYRNTQVDGIPTTELPSPGAFASLTTAAQ